MVLTAHLSGGANSAPAVLIAGFWRGEGVKEGKRKREVKESVRKKGRKGGARKGEGRNFVQL